MAEKLKAILDGIDLTKILPKLDAVLGKVYPVLRFALLIGPFVLLILGLAYFFLAPREANNHFGYRCFFGMGSPEAWRACQKIAGLVWAVVGSVLLVVMAAVSGNFGGMATDAAVVKTVTCILWEVGAVALSCIVIDLTMAILYNRKGERRRK